MVKCELKKLLVDMPEIDQRTLARAIGLSETSLSAIARGRQVPRVDIAIRISRFIKRPVDEIWIVD